MTYVFYAEKRAVYFEYHNCESVLIDDNVRSAKEAKGIANQLNQVLKSQDKVEIQKKIDDFELTNPTGVFYADGCKVYFDGNYDGVWYLIDETCETPEQADLKAKQMNTLIIV